MKHVIFLELGDNQTPKSMSLNIKCWLVVVIRHRTKKVYKKSEHILYQKIIKK